MERFPGANSSTLTIPSVQKWNAGSYHCIVSNIVGTQTTEPVKLTIGEGQILSILIQSVSQMCTFCIYMHAADPPKITIHPQEIRNAVPDKFAMFTVQAIGTEHMYYHWQCKIRVKSGEWQLCDVESFPGATSSTLIIPSVQKSDEGSYRCIVSNIAGSETSGPAFLVTGEKFRYVWECHTCTHMHQIYVLLSIAESPRITGHPQEVKDAIPNKPVSFAIQAIGTEPLSYQWERKPGDGSGGWQLCHVEWFLGSNNSELTISCVQKSDKGSYRCIVSNIVGSQTSEAVELSIGKIQITYTYHKSLHCIFSMCSCSSHNYCSSKRTKECCS